MEFLYDWYAMGYSVPEIAWGIWIYYEFPSMRACEMQLYRQFKEDKVALRPGLFGKVASG